MSLNNTIDMSVNLEKQPDRNGRGSKRISRPPILSNFQKHESLVATDMGDSLKKWPTNQKLNQQQARGGVSLIKKKALRATKLNPLKKDTLQKAPVLAYEPNPTEAVEDLLEAHISPNASPKMNPSSLVNDRTMRGNHTTHEDPSELQLLLRRAEGLLSQVTKATSAHTSSSIPSPSSQYENIPGPPVMTSSRPLAVATDAQISEIDLLISGLPDAYEEPEIDDDAVQRLLSLGGVPPSQLEYHSLYAVNQTILKKLNEVKYLHLHLNNVIIFGKKFGVRKNFSFLTVKGPEGATIHCNNIRSIHLNDKKFKIDSDMRKSSHQLNSASRPIKMEPFLVGEVNLDESLSWEISFNETLLHSWRESSRLSRSVRSDCLRIELFSTIVPPGKDGKWEPVCFAAAYLPLFGLLALESLAAAVTCDFEVNPLVYQLVQARMQNLPLGLRRTSTGFDRGEDGELIRLGTLSGSVWLETHDQSSIRSAEMKDRATLPPLMSEIVQQRPLSGSSEESMIYQERREREEGLSSALNYIPKEMPSTAQDGQRYLGMAFISIRLDLIFDQLSYGSPYKVIVAYKESKRCQELIEGYGTYAAEVQTNPAYEVGPHIKADLLSYRIMDERHHQSMSLPVFEVWLEWVDATSGGLLRRLWGIAEQKEGFAFKAEDMEEEITLKIRDVGKDLQVGELLLTLVCSQKREATISKLTSFFSAPSFQAELVEPTSIATVPSAPDSYDPPSLTMLSIARTSHSLLNETLNSTMSMDSLSSSVRSSATSSPLPTRICDPTDRLDHISLPPPLAISETEAALSSNFPSLRIFEVRVVNTFQIRAAEGGGSDSSRLKLLEREAGAFLTYSFDKRCEQEGKDPVSRLWWDADCAILNGRASHRLKFSSATALSSFLNLGITLRLQLPREENRLENDDFEGADTGEEVGEALLDASLLRQVFATTGEFNITLPVVDSTNSIKSSLRLALHHHIEPLILQSTELRSRRSVDNLKRRLSISGDKAAAEGEVSGVFLFLEKAVHVTLNRENVKASSSLHWECNWILPDNETDTFISVKSKSLSQDAESLVWCEPLLLPFPFLENMNGQSSFDASRILRRFLRIKLCLTLYITEERTVTALGKALIDPALFAYGMASIEGWYDITDILQCTLGQLKLSLSLTSSSVLREGGFDAASSPIDCDEASNCIKKINSEVEQGFNDCSLEELREKLSSLLGSKERRNEKDFEVTILSFPSAPDDDVSEYYYRSREDEPAEDLDSVLIDAFDFTESEEEDDPYGLEDFMNNFQKDSSDSSYCFSIPAASSTPSSSHYSLLSSSPKASTSSSLSSPSAFSLAVEKVPEIQTIEALDSTSCCTIPLLPSLPQHLSFNFCQDPLDDILYHTLSSEVFNSSSSSKILNGAEDYGVDTDTLKQALNVSAVISEIGIEDKKDCSFTSTGIPLISSIAEIRYDQDHDGMSCDVGGVLPEVDDLAHWLKGKRNAVIDNAYLGEDSRTKTLGSPVGVLKEQDHDAVLRSENDCGGSLNTNSSVDKKPESACRYAKSAVKDVSRMTEDAVSLTEAAVQTECSAIGPFSLLNLEIGAVMLEALDSATKTDEKNDGGSVVDPTWMVSPLESVEGDSIFLPEKEPYTNAIDANQAEDGRIEYFDALPNSAINLHALAISKADRAMAAMVNSGSEVSAHKVQHNTILRTPPAPLITTEYIDAEIMKALPSLSVGSHGNHRSLKMKLAVDQEMERIARIMLQRRTPIASRIV